MNSNIFALQTISYIWSHPNCQQQKLQSIFKFVGWQLYKRLTHKYLDIQLLANVKLRCYPDSSSASAVLYCGLYDYDDMNFLLRYLRADDSFLDIGANIGVYSLLAASKIQTGLIHSFEILPKNHSRLQENLQLNQFKQVKTYEIAVSDSAGTVDINLNGGDSTAFISQTATGKNMAVATNTLDNLLKNSTLKNLTLAKMDIEGAELLALKGAMSLLKQKLPQVWILEINDSVNNFGYEKQDLVDFLHSYGYGLYRYDANTTQITSIKLEQQQGNNVLAIAESALDFVCDRLHNYQ